MIEKLRSEFLFSSSLDANCSMASGVCSFHACLVTKTVGEF